MKAIVFPGKYYQGAGALEKLGDLMKTYQIKKPMIIWGKRAKKSCVSRVDKSLSSAKNSYSEYLMETDCTKETCRQILGICKKDHCDIVIGIGGGKVMDMAKAVAHYHNVKVIIAPTVPSSDAAASACTVWYDDQHVHADVDFWPENPMAVIADTEIMVNTPERMLAAGIGDALATNLEIQAAGDKETRAGGLPTEAVKALAERCFDILLEYADEAMLAGRMHQVTPSYEKVVEATILLSGIGWESGGLCTAHVFGNGLTDFKETAHCMHGELVAFGIVVQLVLDPNVTAQERKKIISFLAKYQLPVCLEDLNMQEVSKERLYEWCVKHTGAGSGCHKHPFSVTEDTLYQAILGADLYGKAIRNGKM